MRRSVLVIEDHAPTRQVMAMGLGRHGFTVVEAATAAAGLEELARGDFDVVCLDLTLPDAEGLDVCREIRRHSGVPIIVVSGRDDSHDVVAGLEAGADDYVRKPFSVPELRARIRSVLRRLDDGGPAGTVVVGDLEIRPLHGSVLRDGREVALTRTEYRLLCELAARPGQAVERRDLLTRVWGPEYDDERLVDVHVARLRRKVEARPEEPQVVRTVRGVGYALGR